MSLEEPDPVLKFKHVVGFGGGTTKHVLMNSSGSQVVYPCHAILVLLDVSSGSQQLMVGHTDKISCLAVDQSFSLAASGQQGDQGLVRLWNLKTLKCAALVKTHDRSVFVLSMSKSGNVLCGVGKDARFRNLLVVWDVSDAIVGGQVKVVCKDHFEAPLVKMVVFPFFENRMVSCGRGNVRMWRTKKDSIKSTPVDLLHYHCEDFLDISFESATTMSYDSTSAGAGSMVYLLAKSGKVIVVDCNEIRLKSIIDIKDSLPNCTPSFVPSSLLMTRNYACVGSTDGTLSVTSKEFDRVLLNVALDGSIDCLAVSHDLLDIVCGTAKGSLGILNLKSRHYKRLQSSCDGKVTNVSIDDRNKNLALFSQDGTVRVLALPQMEVYCEFYSSSDLPLLGAFHPKKDVLACGFTSGMVRVFHLGSVQLLFEYLLHGSPISGLTFDGTGSRLHSSSSCGLLVMHEVDLDFTADVHIEDEEEEGIKRKEDHSGQGDGSGVSYKTGGVGVKKKGPAKHAEVSDLKKKMISRDDGLKHWNDVDKENLYIDKRSGDQSHSVTKYLPDVDVIKSSSFKQARIICNAAVKSKGEGDLRRSNSLALSSDGHLLAFVGPTRLCVTVTCAHTLNEVNRVDLSELLFDRNLPVEECLQVRFSTGSNNCLHLLMSGNRIFTLDHERCHLIRKLENVHNTGSSVVMDTVRGTDLLVTAVDRILKVWHSGCNNDINFQSFIGHSEPISHVTCDSQSSLVFSSGETLFIWELLGTGRKSSPEVPRRPVEINEKVIASYMDEMPRIVVPEPSDPFGFFTKAELSRMKNEEEDDDDDNDVNFKDHDHDQSLDFTLPYHIFAQKIEERLLNRKIIPLESLSKSNKAFDSFPRERELPKFKRQISRCSNHC